MPDLNQTDLKPCPFCGGSPVYDHDDDGWNWIVCRQCGITTNASTHCGEDCRPKLAETWNRRPAVTPLSDPWIPVTERLPEVGTDCLVWAKPSWAKEPYALVDRWDEQRECPVAWSAATVPIGPGWDGSEFDDVTHWMPLPPPPGAIKRAISAAPTPACDSSGTVDCQSTAASHRCADCPHGGPVADEADQTIKCLPDGVMFDAFGNPRMRYVRVSYDGSHLILSLPEVEEWRMEAEAAAARVGQTDPHTYSDVYLSKEEADALPEFDGF